MPRDDRYLEVRRRAAHDAYGRKHYKMYVYPEIARRAAPAVFVLLALAGLLWAWYRVPHLALGLISAGLAGLLLAGLLAYHLSGQAIAARGAGRGVASVPVLAAVVLLAAAAVGAFRW